MKKILYFFLALMFLFGCNEKKKEVIRIGAILPLTGDLSPIGELGKNGLNAAKDYLNLINGNNKIEILIEDGQGNPTKSLLALNKLISVEKVNVVFSIISSVDLSILPIQEQKKFLFVSHSTHPNLSNVNNLVFRHSPTVEQESQILLEYLNNRNKIAIAYMADEYGEAFKNILSDSIPNAFLISFPKGEFNFQSIASKIVSFKPETVIICGAGISLSNLVIKLREQGYSKEIISTLAYKVSGASSLTRNIKNLTLIDFKDVEHNNLYNTIDSMFVKKYNRHISTPEILFFNSVLMIYYSSHNDSNIDSIAKQLKVKAPLK